MSRVAPSPADSILMDTGYAFWTNYLDEEGHTITDGSTAQDRLFSRIPPPPYRSRRPNEPDPLPRLRFALIVTAINSLTQKVYCNLTDRGILKSDITVCVFGPSREEYVHRSAGLLLDLCRFMPDIVLCPYLTSKIPPCIYERFFTLIYHPGPPGDGGPSSIDWLLLGDDGHEPDSSVALEELRNGYNGLRSHWGGMVFQPTPDMDKGPVWAWDEYKVPHDGITKAQLYQTDNAAAALNCFNLAIDRLLWTAISYGIEPGSECFVRRLVPFPEWTDLAVSTHKPFHGGPLHYRPLLKAMDREIELYHWTAEDIYRFVSASDSQPGARLGNLTGDSSKALFVYGAHLHRFADDVPSHLYHALGYHMYDDVPDGTALAVRDGAVFFKTVQRENTSAGVWLTMGRIIKPLGETLEAKIPLVTALARAGHGAILEGLQTWELNWHGHRPHEWQEIFVVTTEFLGYISKFVYWDFYNGAFTTYKCKQLLQVLQWASHPDQGNVRVLALMGGHYFCNGIALNTIEDAVSQSCEMGEPEEAEKRAGMATWQNINAMNDIVEFLIGDTHLERSDFLKGSKTLCERGIVTLAGVRGNAAAGGVALAAACDFVVISERATLNPAYRSMGLHGSEFHSWSYAQRCGQETAGKLLRDMLPVSPKRAIEIGLADYRLAVDTAGYLWTPDPVHECMSQQMVLDEMPVYFKCAPWGDFNRIDSTRTVRDSGSFVNYIATNKRIYFGFCRFNLSDPPLLHYRNEELSQMLLDSFHPIRAQRYHSRRRIFIRKIKCGRTPTRYAKHLQDRPDAEETAEFDAVGEWKRGAEWGYVGLPPPASLRTSSWTVVPLFADKAYEYDEDLEHEERLLKRAAIIDEVNDAADAAPEIDPLPLITSPISSAELSEMVCSPLPLLPDSPLWERKPVKVPDPRSPRPVETMYACFYNDPRCSP